MKPNISSLVITVRFCSDRYNGFDVGGRPEWPPSPARLFQALAAGAAKGAVLRNEDRQTLVWLEQLKAPTIAAPIVHKGQSFRHFMPNNDIDAVDGDPGRIGEIRTASKRFHPRIFDPETPFLYVWSFDHMGDYDERMCEIAEQIYQVGRGIDMAWAVAEILDPDEAEACLSTHGGAIYRPATKSGGDHELACPLPGSLKSLIERYGRSRTRFATLMEPAGTKRGPSRIQVAGQTLSQPPKPRFCQVSYNSPPVRLLYELRDTTKKADFHPWPLSRVARLVETIRNDAATKLREAFPNEADVVARVFGLCRDATEADKAVRIRIIPLPSIGHQHADYGVRRLLVEISPNCPLAADDIDWAFSRFGEIERTTGEVLWTLVSAEERGMLSHYGAGDNIQSGFCFWRTVTPMALPEARSRGQKKGSERADIERGAAAALTQALRYAGVTSRLESLRLQREPFDAKGARAESFAPCTRFAPGRLWHVEITFAQPVAGTLLTGDGRYLGLGLMKPVKQVEGAYAFIVVTGLSPDSDSQSVARALRRAVMALAQGRLGLRAVLPTFFSGHEADGSPARRGGKSHLAFVFDEARKRLLVIAPHLLEGRQPSQAERKHLRLLDAALTDLRELRAGSAGLLRLKRSTIVEDDDPLFAQARTWVTQSAYRPTRHSKETTPEQAIIADVGLELRRRGLPMPASISNVRVFRGPKGRLRAQLKLVFLTAARGPMLLGQNCNFGSGLFVAIG